MYLGKKDKKNLVIGLCWTDLLSILTHRRVKVKVKRSKVKVTGTKVTMTKVKVTLGVKFGLKLDPEFQVQVSDRTFLILSL